MALEGPPDTPEKMKRRNEALETRGKTIVFCQSVEAMKALKSRLEAARNGRYRGRIMAYSGTQSIGEFDDTSIASGKKLQKMIYEGFKSNPDVDILLANDAAQTGLSIPQADLVVNYEMNWNPQAMNQRIDRAHRLGKGASLQVRPVHAFNIVTQGTVEEKKIRAHAFKQQLFNAFIASNERDVHGRPVSQGSNAQDAAIEQARKLASPKFTGDDSAAVMDDIIDTNPDLQNLRRATEKELEDLAQRKRMNALANKRMMPQKRSVISRLMKWW